MWWIINKNKKDESQCDKLINKDFQVQGYFNNVIKDNKKGYLIDGLYIEKNYRSNGYAKAFRICLKVIRKRNAVFHRYQCLKCQRHS